MRQQGRPDAAVAVPGRHRDAMHLPGFGEVLGQRDEAREAAVDLCREGRPDRAVGDIHEERLLDAEPSGQRAKNRFDLGLAPQLGADDVERHCQLRSRARYHTV
jgi:hypothetical protein